MPNSDVLATQSYNVTTAVSRAANNLQVGFVDFLQYVLPGILLSVPFVFGVVWFLLHKRLQGKQGGTTLLHHHPKHLLLLLPLLLQLLLLPDCLPPRPAAADDDDLAPFRFPSLMLLLRPTLPGPGPAGQPVPHPKKRDAGQGADHYLCCDAAHVPHAGARQGRGLVSHEGGRVG